MRPNLLCTLVTGLLALLIAAGCDDDDGGGDEPPCEPMSRFCVSRILYRCNEEGNAERIGRTPSDVCIPVPPAERWVFEGWTIRGATRKRCDDTNRCGTNSFVSCNGGGNFTVEATCHSGACTSEDDIFMTGGYFALACECLNSSCLTTGSFAGLPSDNCFVCETTSHDECQTDSDCRLFAGGTCSTDDFGKVCLYAEVEPLINHSGTTG